MTRENPFKFKYKEPVWFLSTTWGFVNGTIKRVLFQHDSQYKAGYLEYLVTCGKYTSEYMGDRKLEHEIFTTKKEMIEYYSKVEA